MSGHTDELKAARRQMVEQRRRIAGSLSRSYQRGSTENFWKIFIEIQIAIEAIDRASADEHAMTNQTPVIAGEPLAA